MFISMSYTCMCFCTIPKKWPYQPKHSPSGPLRLSQEVEAARKSEMDGKDTGNDQAKTWGLVC